MVPHRQPNRLPFQLTPPSPRRDRGGSWVLLLAVIAALAAMHSPAPTCAQVPAPELWTADGPVRAAALIGSTLYIGGEFKMVGPRTGNGVTLDLASGTPMPSPAIDGDVQVAVADGSGGWYAAGSFTAVGGMSRPKLAHILGDGSVSAWNASVDGSILAMVKSGDAVYIGGSFTTVNGEPRSNLAALDAGTGAVLAWNASTDGNVLALATDGATLYAGGLFEHLGGSSRHRAGAVELATGTVTAWHPNPSGIGGGDWITAMAVDGGTVYLGGLFQSIGGVTRNRMAAVDTSTGAPNGWNPNANYEPYSLVVHGNLVYAGGAFTTVRGFTRTYAAAMNRTTGLLTSWNPTLSSYVRSIAVAGGVIYLGGDFLNADGRRCRVAAYDSASGLRTSWAPTANDVVTTLAIQGNRIFAGGRFSSIGGVARENAAALDLETGVATAWAPEVTGAGSAVGVHVLAAAGNTVYAGGRFDYAGGMARSNLAALDAVSGAATAWNPSVDGPVDAMALEGTLLYIGGNFSYAGGLLRRYAAALSTVTGAATPWYPNPSYPVQALVVGNGAIYVGGGFNAIGGQLRNRLAALDPGTGAATPWNPNLNGDVLTLAISGNRIYAGGAFTTVGATNRSRIAAIDLGSGDATPWNPGAGNTTTFIRVNTLVVDGPRVIAGGHFGSIGGQTRTAVAELDTTTGSASPWDPQLAGGQSCNSPPESRCPAVLTIVRYGDEIVLAGAFESVSGRGRTNLAAFHGGLVVSVTPSRPAALDLGPIVPNPTSSRAMLRFTLGARGPTSLTIHDVLGRHVATLLDGEVLAAGAHQASVRTAGWPPGCYFALLKAAGSSRRRTMVVID